MTLEDLIRRFRVLARDVTPPHAWHDDDVVDWLNDAQAQAAIRGRLIREDALAAVCHIALTAGTSTYALHASVFEIINLRLTPSGSDRHQTLDIVTREWLDAELPCWRTTDRPARWAIQDDTTLRVVGAFDTGSALDLECYRLPLTVMDDDDHKPEIHQAHHEHLIQWALHKAFSVPDSEKFDPKRSDLAEQAFTAYFGLLPDSDLRRSTRADVPQYNRSPLPM